MIGEDDIQGVLQPWFVAVTGLSRVIWGDQGRVRPDRPYGMLKIIAGPVRWAPYDDKRMPKVTDDGDQMQVVGLRFITLSCQVFGEGAVDFMNLAQASLGKPTILEGSFWQDHEAIISVDSVVDDTDYTITINGAEVTIDSGAGASAASIRAALLVEFDDDVIPFAIVDMNEDGTDLVVTSKSELDIAVSTELSIDSETTGIRLAYVEDEGVVDLTEVLEVGFTERSQMDVRFNVSIMTTDDPSSIETAEVEQTVYDQGGNIANQDTYTVDV